MNDDDTAVDPPPAPEDLAVPMWAHSFQVGETFPLRGWVVRITGHFVQDGYAAGFALTVEGPTHALQKRLLAEAKRRTMKVVKK